MVFGNSPARAALMLLLLLELWLFTGSFDKFFNHDSLFYLIHTPRSFEDLKEIILAPDSAKQYRPLSLAFMGLVVPILGLDPRPYHWLPVVFHLLNTVLFYWFARRLLADSVSVLAAVGFWGLHSVVAWIAYDASCISDLLLATFFLSSLLLAVDGLKRDSWLRMCGSLILFLCALFTKEAALTFPLALLLALCLADLQRSSDRPSWADILQSVKRALPYTSIALVLTSAHAALLLHWLKSGALYTQGTTAAYDINPWANLAAKTRYMLWGLNLPDPMHIPHAGALRLLAFCSIGFILLIWGFDFFLRKGRLAPVEWAGALWFAGLSIPALMLSSRLAKWYLYVPLLGLAMALGSLAGRLRFRLVWIPQTIAAPAALFVFLTPFLFSSIAQTRSYLASSDAVYASDILESCLKGLRRENPSLGPQATVYLLPLAEFEKNVGALLKAPPVAGGKLFELFYPGTRVRWLSADSGDRLTEDCFKNEGFRIVQYLLGHLNDVTAYYKGRRRNSTIRRVIRDLADIQATVSRNEYYPEYDRFLTPGGGPVFFPAPDREIFTQIGGSTATATLDQIPPGSRLRFETAWMFTAGDGAWAELSVRSDGKEDILYREYMNPVPAKEPLRWKEAALDLSPYAGRKAELILKCYNDPGKTTTADWLSWRDIVIECPPTGAGRNLASNLIPPRQNSKS